MGIRASHTAEVVFDDVRVPSECLLGGKEKLEASWPGPARAASLRPGRPWRPSKPPARSWAPRPSASPAPPTSTRSTTPRSASSSAGPIIENQAIAFMLADMATEIDAARLLVRRAAWLARNGEGFKNAEGSMSKLKAGRTAVWVTERAIQILGGYGYVRDYPVERWHRDAKIYDIFEGTEQIQQLVIGRAISGLRIR